MHRVVGWLVGIVFTFVLLFLGFLGWLKWLIIGVMVPVGMIMGYFGFVFALHPEKIEPAFTKRKRIMASLIFLCGMALLFTFLALWTLDIIQPSLDEGW